MRYRPSDYALDLLAEGGVDLITADPIEHAIDTYREMSARLTRG